MPITGKRLFVGSFSETISFTEYNDLMEEIEERVVPPNGKISLIRLLAPTTEKSIILKRFLKYCVIKVEYTNVYNNPSWDSIRKL